MELHKIFLQMQKLPKGFIIDNPHDLIYTDFTLPKNMKIFFGKDNKNHIINIEITKNGNNIIVTGFMARNSYFKNLKLLWGTAPSPSQQPP